MEPNLQLKCLDAVSAEELNDKIESFMKTAFYFNKKYCMPQLINSDYHTTYNVADNKVIFSVLLKYTPKPKEEI